MVPNWVTADTAGGTAGSETVVGSACKAFFTCETGNTSAFAAFPKDEFVYWISDIPAQAWTVCLALKANGAFLAFYFNLWVILEVSDDGVLEALQFIHTSLCVRTVIIVSPLSGGLWRRK